MRLTGGVRAEQITVDEALPLRHAVLRNGDPTLTAAFPEDHVEGCFHVGVRAEDGSLVATATLMPEASAWRPTRRAWRLRGMAVAPELQGRGLGRVVLDEALGILRERGGEVLWANARDTALGFYERLGMEVVGEQFEEGPHRLPHHVVVLDLCPPPVRRVDPASVTTERLQLDPWSTDDLDDFARLMALPEVTKYPWGEPFTRERSQEALGRIVGHWDRFGFGLWKATERAGGDVCGWIGLSMGHFLPAVMPAVEVGWRLDPRHWGRGYATEGGAAALEFGFTVMGLERIISIYESPNEASGEVMKRIGMTFWRDFPDPVDGRPLHVYEKRCDA